MEQKQKGKMRRLFEKYCEKHSFRPVVVAAFAVALAALVIFLAIGNKPQIETVIVSKPAELKLMDIGELATQAAYVTTVQTISKSRNVLGVEIPGTQSNYVYSYDGTVKAGIDFADINMDVDNENHIIRIQFPEFKIMSVEINFDSFMLYNDGTNLFTSLKIEEINQGNAELQEIMIETAIQNGILENARSNAEVLVRGLLSSAYDLRTYMIEFLP